MQILSLCSGIGGLDLGVKLACPGSRVVCHVEREAFCAAVLVARMRDGTLDDAPIWDDLTTFDGRAWRGKVDLVTAGFPCQPHSVAGARKGLEDDRWIWPQIATILRDVRPRFVFLENVPGLVTTGGLAAVLADLAALRFDAAWAMFRASDVGAPHRRERLFILGVSDSGRDFLRTQQRRLESAAGRRPVADSPSDRPDEGRPESTRELRRSHAPECRDAVADSGSSRQQEHGRSESAREAQSRTCGDERTLVNTRGERCLRGRLEEREQHQGARRNELVRSSDDWLRHHWPPGPDVGEDGWPVDLPQPAVRRDSDGLSCKMDRLRALGNAVVPQQAALALETLWRMT